MRKLLPALVLLPLLAVVAWAQDEGPAPPKAIHAEDFAYDWGGETVLVKWSPAADQGTASFAGYRIQRAASKDGPWTTIAEVDAKTHLYLDKRAGKAAWFYRVSSLAKGAETPLAGPPRATPKTATAEPNRFKEGRFNSLFFVFLFCSLILGWVWTAGRKVPGGLVVGYFVYAAIYAYVIVQAGGEHVWVEALVVMLLPVLALAIPLLKRGGEIYIRPIPAIQAVEEAIGRATEMGKPILYVPGISTIEDVATLASLNILGPVAEKAARYDSRLIVPNYDPIVYTVTQEVVKGAYLKAGRPDAYSDDNVFYLSARQFAYAAAVNGIMVREKPATNFLLGTFYAESLLLAETGNMTGAIQIAGTDMVTQLPFFIVACDYTLIGEELYAAGSYMGGDPRLTGGLKGQDWNKALVIAAIVVLTLGFSIYGVIQGQDSWARWIHDLPEKLFEVGR
ncbi:MAG: DUF6754 domain-containing protein [Planctomycetota bacterium]